MTEPTPEQRDARGRRSPLTPESHDALIKDLTEGTLTHADLSRKYSIHATTVTHTRERYTIQIEAGKKKLLANRSSADFNRSLTVFQTEAGAKMLAAMREMTAEKLTACSAPQLAVVCGVLFDKLRIMEDKMGDTTPAVRYESRREMVTFIMQGEPGEDPAAPLPGLPAQVAAGLDASACPPPLAGPFPTPAGDPPALPGPDPVPSAAGDPPPASTPAEAQPAQGTGPQTTTGPEQINIDELGKDTSSKEKP